MTLNPPADICGDLGASGFRHNRALRAKRSEWINSLPDSFTARQIANALGVTPGVVHNAAPSRAGIVPQAVAPTSVHVTMPAVPGITISKDRPETAPRAGIISPPRATSVEDVIAIIRAERDKARAAA